MTVTDGGGQWGIGKIRCHIRLLSDAIHRKKGRMTDAKMSLRRDDIILSPSFFSSFLATRNDPALLLLLVLLTNSELVMFCPLICT